jgi:Periplasmic binding protein-like domain
MRHGVEGQKDVAKCPGTPAPLAKPVVLRPQQVNVAEGASRARQPRAEQRCHGLDRHRQGTAVGEAYSRPQDVTAFKNAVNDVCLQPGDQVLEVDLKLVPGVEEALCAEGVRLVGGVFCPQWQPREGYEATKRLLKRHGKPEALIFFNDRLSVGVYHALEDAGFKVPDEVSVVSFDDEPLASWCRRGPQMSLRESARWQARRAGCQPRARRDPPLPATCTFPERER